LKDIGIDWRIILVWLLEKYNGRAVFFWLKGQEPGAGCCGYNYEPLTSTKCGQFHDLLRKYQLKKVFSPCGA
jgi:hypothetical protein